MEQLLRLLPDDEPELFYKKLLHMSNETLERELKRFEEMTKYTNIINAHLRLNRRPEYNVKLVYNKKGWHLTSCEDSNPDYKIIPGDPPVLCTCSTDIKDPEKYFDKLEREIFMRCSLCKQSVPEWETNFLNPTKNEPVVNK